jgi:hypothetical protein
VAGELVQRCAEHGDVPTSLPDFLDRFGSRPRAPPADLLETLPTKIQVRANAVRRYRMDRGKAVLTSDTLDQITAFAAVGKIKVCPPFTDSDGYKHLTGQEAK